MVVAFTLPTLGFNYFVVVWPTSTSVFLMLDTLANCDLLMDWCKENSCWAYFNCALISSTQGIKHWLLGWMDIKITWMVVKRSFESTEITPFFLADNWLLLLEWQRSSGRWWRVAKSYGKQLVFFLFILRFLLVLWHLFKQTGIQRLL